MKAGNRALREPFVGATASYTRTLTDGDVAMFVGVTWDVNPYHTSDTFAMTTRFGRRIVPGLLTASLFTHLGGLWSFLATRMTFEFVAPVYVGDTIRVDLEIVEYEPQRRATRLRGRCVTQEGREVLRAEVEGIAPDPGDGDNG